MASRVVVIGGGFGGLATAAGLLGSGYDVVLIDRANFHCFQPLLYQVATGALSPGNITAPIRAILGRRRGCRVLMANVESVDVDGGKVLTDHGAIAYDRLVLAAGARTSYFGNDEWAETSEGLKTMEDAVSLRNRILERFEDAEWSDDLVERRRLLTFVVVGGGPTGVELAGAIAELARHTLRGEFANCRPEETRVVLLEGDPTILNTFAPKLRARARRDLERLGVEVRTDSMVVAISEGKVTWEADGERHDLAGTICWAAGVEAAPLARSIGEATGAEVGKDGRIDVDGFCRIPGHQEIFAIGDLARHVQADGSEVPGLAPAALQQGRYVARSLQRELRGKDLERFAYLDKGVMATIGRNRAVAQSGKFRLAGRVAWLAWLFVHLMYLVGFDNRLLVLVQWGWNYFTRGRNARLILRTSLRGDKPGK